MAVSVIMTIHSFSDGFCYVTIFGMYCYHC